MQDAVHTRSGKGNSAFAEQQKRLFQRVVQEVKGFVALIHDAVIRFYMLDVKVGLQHRQNANLTNLLTSLVLKSPVYSEVHALIRLIHKPQYKKIVQTIEKVRSNHNLESIFKIDPVEVGRTLIKTRREEKKQAEMLQAAENPSAEAHLSPSPHEILQFEDVKPSQVDVQPQDIYPSFTQSIASSRPIEPQPVVIDRKAAKTAFRSAISKIAQVRNISSPILKVITIKRYIDELMAAINGVAS